MEPELLGEFSIFADYNMFFLLADATAVPRVGSGLLTALMTDLIAGAGPGAVIVGTVRRVPVPVTVELRPDEPADSGAWDHIAEAGIRTTTGVLRLVGDASAPDDGPRVPVPPGEYRVRVYSSGFDTLSDDGLDGDDRYRLVLWPDTVRPPRVVRRYPGELPGG